MNRDIRKKIQIAILSIVTVMCMSVNLEVASNFGENFSTFTVMDIAYIIIYGLLFTKIADIKDKRAKICCAILAAIFRIM